MVLWCFVEEQRDTVEIVTLLLVLAMLADVSQGYIFPPSTLGLLRLCWVMGMVPKGLSTTRRRNGAWDGPWQSEAQGHR